MDIKEMTDKVRESQISSSNNEEIKKFCQIEPDNPTLQKIQQLQDLIHELVVSKLKNGLAKDAETAHIMEQLSFMSNFLDQYTRTALKIALIPKMKYTEQ